MVKLSNVLSYVLKGLASSKTEKYFLSTVETRLGEVVDTIEALRAAKGSTITVDGDIYNISEYQIPKALLNYVRSGTIYGSKDAVGKAMPILEVKKSDGKLTPIKFNTFFNDYNSYQHESVQIPMTSLSTKEPVTVEDVDYLEDQDGLMAKLHESGFGIETCSMIGLKIEGFNSFLATYTTPTLDAFTSWMVA